MLDESGALIRAERGHVLEADGGVRGVLVLIAEGSTMLLATIAVYPACQERGYGRALLELAARMAPGGRVPHGAPHLDRRARTMSSGVSFAQVAIARPLLSGSNLLDAPRPV